MSDPRLEQKEGDQTLKSDELPPTQSEEQKQQSPPHSMDPFDTSSDIENDKESGRDYDVGPATEEVIDSK